MGNAPDIDMVERLHWISHLCWWTLCICLLFNGLRLTAQDCVPLTYTTLSHLAGHDVSYQTWMVSIMPTGQPADLQTALVKWYVTQHLIDLDVVDIDDCDTPLKTGQPYLLICTMPTDEAAPEPDADCHACLCYFHGDHFTLLHTLSAKGKIKGYAVQTLTWTQFRQRLIFLFEVTPASPLAARWKAITD